MPTVLGVLILNLDTEALVWADPALDITAEVVKQLARVDVPAPKHVR